MHAAVAENKNSRLRNHFLPTSLSLSGFPHSVEAGRSLEGVSIIEICQVTEFSSKAAHVPGSILLWLRRLVQASRGTALSDGSLLAQRQSASRGSLALPHASTTHMGCPRTRTRTRTWGGQPRQRPARELSDLLAS